MRIHCLQHEECEGPGCIADWATQNHHSIRYTHVYNDGELPDLDSFDMLLIMGGPMSVHDEETLPWLIPEKLLILRAMQAEKKVLGICLGGQLISEVCGGKVTQNPHTEIGFFPIRISDEARTSNWFGDEIWNQDEFIVFHWHGETFSIPEGATRLFENDVCQNQGFAIGKNTLALQFHLEVTESAVRDMLEADVFTDSGKFIQSPQTILKENTHYSKSKRMMYSLLETLTDWR